jgi:predicted PurR-regulated permease PerM
MNKQRYIFYFIIFILLLLLAWYFRTILLYVLLAGIVSLIGRPVVRFLQKPVYKNWHLPAFVAAAIYLLIVWALLFGFFYLFVPVVITEAKNLSSVNSSELLLRLSAPLVKFQEDGARLLGITVTGFSAQEFLASQLGKILNMSTVSGIFSSLTGFIGNSAIAAFSVTFISFFFLKEETLGINYLYAMIPEQVLPKVQRAMESIRKLLLRYFAGLLLEVVSVSILVTVGMLIVGLSLTQAMLIGLFAGILNMIPYIGPLIGICFGLFIGAVSQLQVLPPESLPLHLFWMLVVFLAVQLIDNLVFQPLIYSGSVHAHPLEIFLVILAGATVAGIPGMIAAVPTYTVLRVLAGEFLAEFRIVKKLTDKL